MVRASAIRTPFALVVTASLVLSGLVAAAEPAISFTRDIKGILSNRCVRCHGPDAEDRHGGGDDGLRLDTFAGATADLGGHTAIVPGKPAESELVARITSTDPDVVMPPPEAGERLTPREVELLSRWIAAGAEYEPHWAYVPPKRPPVPAVKDAGWPRNEIDRFILARLEAEGLAPQPAADRATLARRLALDLTGLPPTPEEVDAFVADAAPDTVERFIDRRLAHDGYGEHVARQWLDLARYADSAGYADDRPRTIWGWRDWVIRACDANMPFDEFTLRQLAGDLLPDATDDDRIATAFHRNTLTNSEGGTIDEEFRVAAVVDRVNTTLSTWMGTTMACAQCHDHKYDPLSQREYFGIYAVFNQTADADRPGEEPVLGFHTPEQESRRKAIQEELAAAEQTLATETPAITAGREAWDRDFPRDLGWRPARPVAAAVESAPATAATIDEAGAVRFAATGKQAVASITLPLPAGPLAAVKLDFPGDVALPQGGSGRAGNGSFVLSGVSARLEPEVATAPRGRFIRVELPGKGKHLSLAEVEAFSGGDNVARGKAATQSSTGYEGVAARGVDGITDGDYFKKNSVTHTSNQDDPWWEVDLGEAAPLERIVLWNRTDGGTGSRLVGARVLLLDDARQPVWQAAIDTPPAPSLALSPSSARELPFAIAFADRSQPGFDAAAVLRRPPDPKDAKAVKADRETGWSTGSAAPASLTLLPANPVDVPAGTRLVLTLRQQSKHEGRTVGIVRCSTSADGRVAAWQNLPAEVATTLLKPAAERSAAEAGILADHYRRQVAPELAPAREAVARLTAELAAIKPATVPVLQELPADQRRVTKLQHRGNWNDLGPEVAEAVPAVFNPAQPSADGRIDRLSIAKWLVDPANPLTARVVVNRIWERLFGIGIVSTSEEFGAQGELPSHPELLDWLACELVERNWDTKAITRLIVSTAAYQQTSKCPPDLVARDPENRLLACGPRVRLPAEVIRDQALAAAGLLARKKGGPSVNPPQPNLGLSAAFGGGIDWKTSTGEDRYRRALYTTWRRSNPYPSMATFDAPNREVCTLRRPRTNTPLQALVTLNDPVYVEAAQALARRMIREGGSTPADRAARGFRLLLARTPTAPEIDRLVRLHDEAAADYRGDAAAAKQMATDPLGDPPADLAIDSPEKLADLAAWTVVANVLLNLDETFMCP
jgi:hypothetical protein